MVDIKGYSQISFDEFERLLHKAKVDCKKSLPELAVCCGIKHTHTINNCFNYQKQSVKDSLMTSLMKCLDIDGFILWVNGTRYYYIATNN